MGKKEEGRPSEMAKELFCRDCVFNIVDHNGMNRCTCEEYCVDHEYFTSKEDVEAKYINNEQMSSSCLGCAFYIVDSGKSHCECKELCNSHDQFISREGVEYEYINHPEHYQMNDKTYEPYKVINAWNLDFNLGSVLKYIARAGKKPGEDAIRDLNKCKEYIDFEIEKLTIGKDC